MSTYHEGERHVQQRAGVQAMAERVGHSIKSTIPLAAQEFLRLQPMLIVGGEGRDGRVWASMLTGEPGFARALDEHTLLIQARFPERDPVGKVLYNGPVAPGEVARGEVALGTLAIEPATRRRMRLNGAARVEEGRVLIRAREVYANCPKYIQKRAWHWQQEESDSADGAGAPGEVRVGGALNEEQAALVGGADTFFIASCGAGGADASHRGGSPGFVRVLGPGLLRFPDYAGNAMFNTLGNIQRDGRVGLLFPDWRSGSTLQIAGRARVLWDAQHIWPGCERGVELGIESVLERPHATALRWQFLEASPFNPTP